VVGRERRGARSVPGMRGPDGPNWSGRGQLPVLRERAELTGALLAAAALAIGACGTGRLDTEKLEGRIQQRVEQQVGVKLKSVECPKDVQIRAGATFHCRAVTIAGDSASVRVTQRDDKGNVSYELVG
jgi:hypothetical protein